MNQLHLQDFVANLMDLDSIISLESALKEYGGAMIIISHDKVFLDAIMTSTLEFTKESKDMYCITEKS